MCKKTKHNKSTKLLSIYGQTNYRRAKIKKYVRLKHAPLLPHKKSCSLKRILLEVRRLPANSFSQNQLIASSLTDKLSTSILARPAIGFISKGTFLFE